MTDTFTEVRARIEANLAHRRKYGFTIGNSFTADTEVILTHIDAQAERIRELEAAIRRAEAWFLEYERQHRLKGTPDGEEKADRNADRAADLAFALLVKVTP